MRSPNRVVRRGLLMAGLVLAIAGTTGCVRVPESGPVVTTEANKRVVTGGDLEFRPQGPVPGMSQVSIVDKFLSAMTATPVRTDVASDFLASDAQSSWDPGRRIIMFEQRDPGVLDGDTVHVKLTGARWVDAQGQWRGDLGDGSRTLDFSMTQEDKQWRIAQAPDALIVPDSWFEDSGYQQANVYYFDPTGRILVPEPVFVPQGGRLATSLVHALVAGPGARLADVSRTYVPTGLKTGLSVPVSEDGIASITLEGDPGPLNAQSTKLMVYQFAWTLRQDPSVKAFRITIGDVPLTLETGSGQFSVDLGSEMDPTAVQASPQLFLVSDGYLASGTAQGASVVSGPFGRTQYGIRDAAVSMTGATVAAVADGGTSLLEGPVTTDGPVGPVVSGAVDLLRPAWDFADRLWIVDRRDGRARVSAVDVGGTLETVRVPGITGKDVTRFIVSRDGTRLVAVVHGARVDELRVSRIRHDTDGRILSASPARKLDSRSIGVTRIRDIGWASTTMVAVLHRLTGDVAQVVGVPVDGSPSRVNVLSQGQRAKAIVSSPVPNETLYTLTPDGLVDPTGADGGKFPVLPHTTAVHYVG
jgi:hypothetical protein